jgi:glycosyltransferase involved in cell wall biosynthesis
MYPKKGFEEILLAYSLIQKKKTLLVMFGQGPLLRTLRKTARKLKIEDNVRFTGYIPTDLMIAYFKACNFIVTINKPSNYVASSSILLNGVAAGKPIITNDEACNAEVVKDNVNGFLVSPVPTSLAKAMEILIAKEGLTKRMSESSRCMSGKMDWKEVNKITYGVYEDALLDHEERINDV